MSSRLTPLIAAVLMVKNEELSVQKTLTCLLDGGIRHFFILDTGSTDKTIEHAAAFMKCHQLKGFIQQEAFIDFSTSRNRALDLAEKYFSDIPFLLMPDAEWYLHGICELIYFCKQELYKEAPAYLITMKMNTMEFAAARLFRTSSHVRFKGVVHEAPEVTATVKTPDSIYFEIKPSIKGIEKTNLRWHQDLVLLGKAYETNPCDPRTVFYLAQTYACLNNLEKAYHFYQCRSELNGWDEENFMTLLRLGEIAELLDKTQSTSSWAVAMDHFLKAFAMRPHRIEPLVRIAEHYWPDNIQTSYLFIRYAYYIPYPKDDFLFIDTEAYHYTRYEIMSRCAWYMGEYALGEEATRLALNVHPHHEHLQKNLTLYQNRLDYEVFGNQKNANCKKEFT